MEEMPWTHHLRGLRHWRKRPKELARNGSGKELVGRNERSSAPRTRIAFEPALIGKP